MKKKKLTLAQRINILRAAVMGANDGILSVAGIVIGVASATSNEFAIFISGMAGMLAGTVSMAMGEWVSVSTQKDSQKSAIATEKTALSNSYDNEFEYVKGKLLDKGVDDDLADSATKEMMDKDALKTTVRQRYGFDINDFTNPYDAALASMISFPIGSILPLFTITHFPEATRIPATFFSVLIALTITGYLAAVLGKSDRIKGVLRNVIAGVLTMVVTYFIGRFFGRLK